MTNNQKLEDHLLKQVSPEWFNHLVQMQEKYPNYDFNAGWIGKMKEFYGKDGMLHSITSPSCCIVGEANGFKYVRTKAKCFECNAFMYSLFNISNWDEFWIDRRKFAEHFLKEHKK